jgi:two-component system, OmpR family, sensor histidine kinase KdpD
MIRNWMASRRSAFGIVVALALVAILSIVMLALRVHLDIATVGLVLVVPVVVGAVLGGLPAGLVATIGGFVVYDILFIKPYDTFAVGPAQNWVPLAVYVVVMALTARATSHLWQAENDALERGLETERMFELSELVVGEHSLSELLRIIVTTVKEALDVEGVVLVLPADSGLEVVATAGRELSVDELAQVMPQPGVPSMLGSLVAGAGEARSGVLRIVALAAGGRPVGLLGLAGLRMPVDGDRQLAIFAHHLAIALERAQLREQAVKVSVLEQVDQLRHSLVGAVSHDLRTPLTTIKAAASTLRDAPESINDSDRDELLVLIEDQTDRLTRLVSNLLDMSRIQSRSLEVHAETLEVATLIEESLGALSPESAGRVVIDVHAGIPPVLVDRVLIIEVLVNLLENALRYAPQDSKVEVIAWTDVRSSEANTVTVCVADHGPGIPPQERPHVFERARRISAIGGGEMSGGAGIGLSIAKAFVEAHGTSIWLESPSQGGALFCFSVPVAPVPRSSNTAPENKD